MKKLALAVLTLVICVLAAVPQAATPAVVPGTASRADQGVESGTRTGPSAERLQLAISSIDYPVTPGDIYQLSYRESAGAVVTRQFQVDGISILDLGVFGKIYALNMPFYQLKQNVENMISRNYTYSTPSLSIVSPGVFRVAIRDGSSRVQYITAWGLSRVSEIMAQIASDGVSTRDVELISRDGKSTRLDLSGPSASSATNGDLLVHPGDTIVLQRAKRTIELRGEVLRPGFYELIDSEDIRDLVQVFGEGFTRKADLERLRIIRATDEGERSEYVAYAQSHEPRFKLADGDIVVVGDRITRRAQVWFEGAVRVPQTGSGAAASSERPDAPAQATSNGRFSYPISEGVYLSDILHEVSPMILPSADLSSALVARGGASASVSVDLRPLISKTDLSTDVILTPDSTVFIPLLLSNVSVSGAVIVPGFIPYLPGAPASYYISQCGGVDPERNWGGSMTIYTQYGKKRPANQAVMPGDSIHVSNNSPTYILERAVPVVSAIVSVVITALTFGMATGVITF